ncbi:MAG: translation initiation factor IF-2 [Candidatus Nanohaloarchaeota archaeon QJJ-5]|nr:translation initiation factor IF-2 [Candidatus Nanohaloarchaeota archaeon QJJ-5]
MVRQPIVSVLGHVDAGKTTLLDYIRGSLVVEKEAGSITQMIGATEVPIGAIDEITADISDQIGVDLTIPGLLFIDTPGHAAFTSLRKRGGSLSDIAILVVDVKNGVQPQTKEAVEILKESETPFVIALNKIDTLPGWQTETTSWTANYQQQTDRLQNELDETIYEIMGDLHDLGITCERFDRVDDFQKKVAIIPISAQTGEGIPELLMTISGLSQQFLGERLEIEEDGIGKATVLEVNEVKGLGTTIDIILYDGVIRNDDTIIIGGSDGCVQTDVKSLLKPEAMAEMRREQQFDRLEQVEPAAGVKISAKHLDDVVAGAPLRAVHDSEDIDTAREAITEQIQEVDVTTQPEGVSVKADSLGSLEAVSKTFREEQIPIGSAEVGKITKRDIVNLEGLDREHKILFGFNTSMTDSASEELANHDDIQVFTSDVIYELVDQYQEWLTALQEQERQEELGSIARPGKFRIMPDHVFRSSNPAVVGVEIIDGAVAPGSTFMTSEGEQLGTIKSVQEDGESIDLATKGDEVALSLTNVQVGRQIEEGGTYLTDIDAEDYNTLKEYSEYISAGEQSTLEEIVDIKDSIDPRWKLQS